jgi:hypothetical protein
VANTPSSGLGSHVPEHRRAERDDASGVPSDDCRRDPRSPRHVPQLAEGDRLEVLVVERESSHLANISSEVTAAVYCAVGRRDAFGVALCKSSEKCTDLRMWRWFSAAKRGWFASFAAALREEGRATGDFPPDREVRRAAGSADELPFDRGRAAPQCQALFVSARADGGHEPPQ